MSMPVDAETTARIAVPAVSSGGPAAPVPRSSGAHGLDKTLFLDVNHFAQHTGWLHAPMDAYANYGVALFALLLIIGWWLARRRRSARVTGAALWAAAGTLLAVGVAQPINHAVAEGRPWESLPHALILAGHSHDFSFPSDHAVMAGAVTAGLFLYHRRLAIISLLAGLLICFARVYIGAHYPQDVAAGFLIGAAVVLVSYAIVRIPLAWLVALAARTPLRVLVTAGPGLAVGPGAGGQRPAGAPGSSAAAGTLR
jgi:membrane-associated phospholipid phosphatase